MRPQRSFSLQLVGVPYPLARYAVPLGYELSHVLFLLVQEPALCLRLASLQEKLEDEPAW